MASQSQALSKSTLIGSICLLTGVKMLLLSTPYRSTDFDVHRNWLAITKKLPLKDWYFESTSIWTLDYPPFFAYFEKFQSLIGGLIFGNGSEIFEISREAIISRNCLYFQKLSVAVSDVFYIIAGYFILKAPSLYQVSSLKSRVESDLSCSVSQPTKTKNFLLLSANLGLLLVDHMHFQYNGFLFGILLWSLYFYKTNQLHKSAFFFAILLNFKHLFLYIAPAFGLVFLLKNVKFNIFKLITVGLTVVLVFIISLGPFVIRLVGAGIKLDYHQQLPQMFSRLFPFKRGLTHSYWAANFWSFYNFLDILLYKFSNSSQYSNKLPHPLTSGVITENQGNYYKILPEVFPSHCAIIVLFLTVIILLKILKPLRPTIEANYKLLLKCIIFSGFTAFMFGWHVHEKAILTVIIPYFLYYFEVQSSSTRLLPLLERNFYLITTFGTASLFGLFFTKIENILKILSFLAYAGLTFPGYEQYSFQNQNSKTSNFELFSKFAHICLLLGLALAIIFAEIIHPLCLSQNFKFLNLMVLSVYCGIGLIYGYLEMIALMVFQGQQQFEKSKKVFSEKKTN